MQTEDVMTRNLSSLVVLVLVALTLFVSAGVSTIVADAARTIPYEVIEMADGGSNNLGGG